MQGGCLVAPTKPKGRPKKGTIPSLGLINFDTTSLLSAVEARKNSNLIGKELAVKLTKEATNYDTLSRENTNQNELAHVSNMNSILAKDLNNRSNNQTTMNSLNQSINQSSFFDKKFKLTF